MSPFMLLAAVAALLNIGFLGTLVYIYGQNLRSLPSYFTAGLFGVAILFIVQNIVIVVFWTRLFFAVPAAEEFVDAAAPFLFAINAAQTIGLAILLRITWK